MKFWKRWPYWVRGVAVVFTVFLIPYLLMFFPKGTPGIEYVGITLIILVAQPFAWCNVLTGNLCAFIVPDYIFDIVVYLILGAFFGWLYGKIYSIKTD